MRSWPLAPASVRPWPHPGRGPAPARVAPLALALVAAMAAQPARATVYRCSQPGGGVAFQGQPCAGAAAGQHQYAVADRRATAVVLTPAHPPRTSSLDGGHRATEPPAAAADTARARFAAGVAERAGRQVRVDELNGRLAGLERENQQLKTAMDRRVADFRAQRGYTDDHLGGADWERTVAWETNALICDDATHLRRNLAEMRQLRDDVARLESGAE